jgi:TetR/AcrR family transcriptional regulator
MTGQGHAMTIDAGARGGTRARRRRKHARAQELRDAALALFVEKGFDATRIEDIAVRAGTSKGTLYLYYPSKDALLQAALDTRASEALAEVRPAAARDGSGVDALRQLLGDVRAHLQDESVCSSLQLAMAEGRRFPNIVESWLCAVVRPLRALIAQAVLRGMDRGEFRKMDADVVAHSLLLPMFMSRLQRQVDLAGAPTERCLDEGFVAQHIELVLDGLVATSGRA